MNIGFIGLGVMGRPMAAHLIKAGHSLASCINVSDIDPDLIAAGLHISESPAQVAAQSEVIITMLPDTADVEKVLLADNGVLSAIDPGKVIVDMSSISPSETRRFAAVANEQGCEYLDAPVSGGQVGAESGKLTIMVGGDPKTFDQVRPLFEIMGSNITLVGDVGSGQICKVANQIIVALNIEAVAEALVFASKAGANPARVREALMGGFAASRVLEAHGEKMIQRKFEPGFRIDLHRKDLNLALNAARELGLGLPNTASAMQLFNSIAAQENGGSLDHSAMILALESLAGHDIG
ncbi:MAG: 2-hydroxy-3-oxopropionate reductase [Gammaproteobacteria bacterium]|nr:2-hydroxy-3-oxopropionate reductase [Gammaproteobacteria bacterium]